MGRKASHEFLPPFPAKHEAEELLVKVELSLRAIGTELSPLLRSKSKAGSVAKNCMAETRPMPISSWSSNAFCAR